MPQTPTPLSFERAPLNWPAVIMFVLTTVPAVTIFPWYLITVGFDTFEVISFVLLLDCRSPPATTACGRTARMKPTR